MTTLINDINDLPPIITFLSSHYEVGFSFPLSIGIFANGKASSFLIKPQSHWPLSEYDQRAGNGQPIEYFEKFGVEVEIIEVIVKQLTDGSDFLFYLRDDYDTRFLNFMGIHDAQMKDISLIDTFNNYDERHQELLTRLKRSKLNMFSVKDVVATLAEQTYDHLKYRSLDEIYSACG